MVDEKVIGNIGSSDIFSKQEYKPTNYKEEQTPEEKFIATKTTFCEEKKSFPNNDMNQQEKEQIKTEKEQTKTEEEQTPEDDVFKFFMNEVGNLPTVGPAGLKLKDKGKKDNVNNTLQIGTPEEEVLRITSMVMLNAVETLKLSGSEATDEEIKRNYRKISLLIHPDKCKHKLAPEAFQIVTKAYEEMQNADQRKKYKDVIEAANANVTKARKKINRNLIAKKENPLTLDTEDADFKKEVLEECDRLLKQREERQSYADKCKHANDLFMQRQEEAIQKEELDKAKQQQVWAEKRSSRVQGWRSFRTDIDEKNFKLRATSKIFHKREQRPDNSTLDSVGGLTKKRRGLDESYKKNWR